MNILPKVKRGGTGTYWQVSPEPPSEATHSPKPEVQGVCW
jgi:hypothetical protein